MTTDSTKRSTEHPIDRPPDTDPQQGHEHPEADPRAPHALQLDDGEVIDGGRGGNKARMGGTWQAGADSSELDPAAEVFSDGTQPSTGPVSSGPGRPRQA